MNDELIKWKCAKCGAEAGSYIDANMGLGAIVSRLMADHKLMSPKCEAIPIAFPDEREDGPLPTHCLRCKRPFNEAGRMTDRATTNYCLACDDELMEERHPAC